MANSSFHLYQLQKLDLRIDQIGAKISNIENLLKNNSQIRDAEVKVKNLEENIHLKEKELSNLDDSSRSKQIKIEQSESSLYKGSISNPKELQDLQIEIDSLKKALHLLEENQLSIMAEMDELNIQLANEKANLSKVFQECEIKNQSLFKEIGELGKEKERLVSEKPVILAQISPEFAQVYENLRRIKNKIAVVSIDEESCSACGAIVTAGEIQKSKISNSLCYCPSCGRIIYAG